MRERNATVLVAACALSVSTAGVVGVASASSPNVEQAPAKTTLGPYRPDDSAPPPASLDAFGYLQRLFATLDRPEVDVEGVGAEVAPGSDADLHQQYLADLAMARHRNGRPLTHTVSLDGEDVRVCEVEGRPSDAGTSEVAGPDATNTSVTHSPRAGGVESADEGSCDLYSGFVADQSGLLVEYSTDGIALDGRFAEVAASTTGPMAVNGGFAFSDDGTVAVVVDVAATLQTVQPHWADARLTPDDGPSIAAGNAVGPDELAAGSSSMALLTFADAPLAGMLSVPVDGDLALSGSLVQVEIVPV